MSTKSSSFYITTAIPYVNAKPHLGHVLEWFQADAIARYQRALGKDVAFTAGADENSLKNVQAAEKAGISTQAWLDQYSQIFKDAYATFNISLTHFGRGSDQKKHWPGVQELWKRCDAAGDIYKKTYTGLYCVGCESFYTPDELIDGKCPEHLTVPETVEEENYFFRLSKYTEKIKQLIEKDDLRIVSQQYKNEMLGFLSKGLEDFSISRSTQRSRGIGVPVPNDATQVMYVWFDALTIYMTAIGWGYDTSLFERYWPANVHVIGKGINRFHSIYWIGMLLSAQLPLPKCVCVHGYITANGQKMSKSLGNVIDPFELIAQRGLEPVRYYLLREIPSHTDGDFSEERFKEIYTAELANGLGNVCSRIAKLCEKNDVGNNGEVNNEGGNSGAASSAQPVFNPTFQSFMDAYDSDKALGFVQLQLINGLDEYLSQTQPWKKSGSEVKEILQEALKRVCEIAVHLQPFMPETAETILQHFSQAKITALTPMFPRLAE